MERYTYEAEVFDKAKRKINRYF